MIFGNFALARKLMEEMNQIELREREDRDARELFLDQMATSISSGGRGLLMVYCIGIIFIPIAFRTVPRVFIRVPMALGLFGYYEEIYFFGASWMLGVKAPGILEQMKSLKEGSKLRRTFLTQSDERY